ncbi:MAG: hypothetical protein ABS55_08775 [Lautropia sp. SCN 70-15]|nr:MAG: hypothetical protein ABS55_08775 [Lautropia sp. SCN 70-15]
MMATHLDAKALGYCNAGLRRWFPRDGVTFDLFRQQGVSTDWLRATGDAMAIRLAEYVERQAASGTNVGAEA